MAVDIPDMLQRQPSPVRASAERAERMRFDRYLPPYRSNMANAKLPRAFLETVYARGVAESPAGLTEGYDGSDAANSNVRWFRIPFPAMPETITLARQANYTPFLYMTNPDGFHVYDSTEPLKIPVKFALHWMDTEYCANGPGTLLEIAAKIHALLVPVKSVKAGLTVQAKNSPQRNDTAVVASNESKATVNKSADLRASIGLAVDDLSFSSSDFSLEGSRQVGVSEQRESPQTDTSLPATNEDQVGGEEVLYPTEDAFYPIPCRLRIMIGGVGNSSRGIDCRGFLEGGTVTFHGPWLSGEYGGQYWENVPTWAEYEFSFVHNPAYTNVFKDDPNLRGAVNSDVAQFKTGQASQTLISAFGPDILSRLYSTWDLATLSNVATFGNQQKVRN